MKRIKHRRAVLQSIPRRDIHDPSFSRLYYVRYADDFVFGFSGPKFQALEIQKAVIKFLKETLQLTCAEQKSMCIHSSKSFTFLGTDIR